MTHREQILTFNKPYKCDICKTKFGDHTVSREHVESEHHVSPAYSGMLITMRRHGRWSR